MGFELNATDTEVAAAREWLRKNYTEVDGWTIGQLGKQSVVNAVEREYDGGWTQFLLDTFPPVRTGYPLWDSLGWLEQHSILAAHNND